MTGLPDGEGSAARALAMSKGARVEVSRPSLWLDRYRIADPGATNGYVES
jgi:hypothetical protein